MELDEKKQKVKLRVKNTADFCRKAYAYIQEQRVWLDLVEEQFKDLAKRHTDSWAIFNAEREQETNLRRKREAWRTSAETMGC